MLKRFWWKGALLVLATGTTLAWAGCWSGWVQRILVDSLFDSWPTILGGQV